MKKGYVSQRDYCYTKCQKIRIRGRLGQKFVCSGNPGWGIWGGGGGGNRVRMDRSSKVWYLLLCAF